MKLAAGIELAGGSRLEQAQLAAQAPHNYSAGLIALKAELLQGTNANQNTESDKHTKGISFEQMLM